MPIPAPTLCLDRARRRLHDGAGLVFDPASLGWRAEPAAFARHPVLPVGALRWPQVESGTPVRQPIGVGRVLDGESALSYAEAGN
jgi:hypothetical protein